MCTTNSNSACLQDIAQYVHNLNIGCNSPWTPIYPQQFILLPSDRVSLRHCTPGGVTVHGIVSADS